MNPPTPRPPRLASLDQFRGYTVAAMFLVNFAGSFHAVPAWLKHHNTYCGFADTIMPQFLLAVGFAFRLTLTRRLAAGEGCSAYVRVVRRNLGLLLLGFLVYHVDIVTKSWGEWQALGVGGFFKQAFQRTFFQALVHIGLTSLWVLPVIARGAVARLAFAAASAILFLIASHAGYYEWVMRRPGIDGGPLGFLTWTIPLIAGSFACDLLTAAEGRTPLARLLAWGAALMGIGYAISCLSLQTPPGAVNLGPQLPAGTAVTGVLVEPPFIPPSRPINLWTMSQRAGSVSYLVFATGFALAVLAGFVWACDQRKWQAAVLATFGTNALAGYLIHDLVAGALKPLVPRDAPGAFVLAGLVLFLWLCWLLVRTLERQRIHLRL